jgi:parallel beta-helix repeat protein
MVNMKKISLLFVALISIITVSCKSGTGSNIEVITVNNAEEFIKALGNDRTIILNNTEGIYLLTEAIDAAVEAGYIPHDWNLPEVGSTIIALNAPGSHELCFYNINNLTIRGADENNYTKIYASPSFVDVLSFTGCTGITLENLELGHYPETRDCDGAVLGLYECDGITINKCELFGCGYTGILATDSENVKVTNSIIRDCTVSNISLYDCENFHFYKCELKSENDIDCYDSKNITFEKCLLPDIVSGDMSLIECDFFYWLPDEG